MRVDTVRNILSNKLCAIVGRDEARDVADLLYIARKRSFAWADIPPRARGTGHGYGIPKGELLRGWTGDRSVLVAMATHVRGCLATKAMPHSQVHIP